MLKDLPILVFQSDPLLLGRASRIDRQEWYSLPADKGGKPYE
jgi:hypothetical protein